MSVAEKDTSLLNQKSLCIITGASRGIGKEIAIRLSRNFQPNSRIILLSRIEADLLTTADEIRQKNPAVMCDVLVCDLSKFAEGDNVKEFEKKLTSALINSGPFDVAFMVHNAGSTGDVSRRVENVTEAAEIREHLETNVVSYILLNNAFLRVIPRGDRGAQQRLVINITSLLGIKSFPGYGLYPVGKAAREAFARSLAAEDEELRVLNYAPGPVKTAMAEYCAKNTWDSFRREWWKDAMETGGVLSTEQTVTKLLRILEENTFESGSHIDYYDLP